MNTIFDVIVHGVCFMASEPQPLFIIYESKSVVDIEPRTSISSII